MFSVFVMRGWLPDVDIGKGNPLGVPGYLCVLLDTLNRVISSPPKLKKIPQQPVGWGGREA